MSLPRFSAKAIPVALLILCMAVAASAQSIATLKAQAASGDANAQYNLGLSYDLGQGLPQDYAEAAVWYRKAAEQGVAEAQDSLGVMYGQGQGVPQDYTQAALWWRKAAEQGNALAEAHLGVAYDFGHGVPQDHTQAAAWFRKAAAQGNASAQFQLGLSYELGHGVPQDYEEAYFWLDIAASGKSEGVKQEDVDKLRDDASSHLTPSDLSRVQERARKWFEDHVADMQRPSAAVAPISAPAAVSASEDAETQFHRGTLYETGNGVQQDYAQAVLWYRKAAEQNLAIAQYRLGVLYANGVGVPLDKSQAAAWFQKAADQGYAYAQELLGLDYLTGEGVQRDYSEAYFWLVIAAEGNTPENVAGGRAAARDAAAAYLSRADLSRVQERVSKWFEDHPAKP